MDKEISDNDLIDELIAQNRQLKMELESVRNSFSFNIGNRLVKQFDRFLLKTTLGKKLRNKLLSSDSELNLKNFSYLTELSEEEAESELQNLHYKPKISIIMPTYNSNIAFLREAIESVRNQFYQNWELCVFDDGSKKSDLKRYLKDVSKDTRIKVGFSDENRGISNASNKALDLATGDFVVFLDHDDKFSRDCLLEVVKLLNNESYDFIYSDEDKINSEAKHHSPFFKPDWSKYMFYSMNYLTHCSVIRKTLIDQVGRFREGYEGSQDYDLFLRVLENTEKIGHISKVLYHWRESGKSTAKNPKSKKYAYKAGLKSINDSLNRLGLRASCELGKWYGTYRIRYELSGNPLVSIIILSIKSENLKRCLKSIKDKTTYENFEVIVINGSQSNDIHSLCEQFEKVRDYKKILPKFNFSEISNFGASKCNGNVLLFLNDDTEVSTPGWLGEMLQYIQQSDVGVVGAKLVYPNDTVQHAGIILGVGSTAANYSGMAKDDPGYNCFAGIVREVTAVSGACLMIKKNLFNELGGFDEVLANSYQDVDLCLRILEEGRKVVYTPYAVLSHYEGGTRGRLDLSYEESVTRAKFKKKNKKFLSRGDAFYNRNLSLTIPYFFRGVIRSEEPMKALLDVYRTRKDLQEKFPEALHGRYEKIIDWIAVYGVTIDSDRKTFLKHNEYFCFASSNKVKDLAKLILEYNKNPHYQEKYPEVMEGIFEKFQESLRN